MSTSAARVDTWRLVQRRKCAQPVAHGQTHSRNFLPSIGLTHLIPPASLEKLRQTPLEVSALLEGLPEEFLLQQPEDGGWAIRNTVSTRSSAA